jgi:peptide/nickel transport system permease protein
MALGKFLLRGIVSVVVVVIGVTALTWLSVNLLRPDLRGGDDRFVLVILADYLQHAFLHFDFGQSFTTRREISDLIRQGLPADLSLLGGALVVGLAGGIAGGAYCAARPRTAGPASAWSASSRTSRPPTSPSPTARPAGWARC